MTISNAGLELIKKAEGLRLVAYQDAVKKIWTIGYGHIGPDVTQGLVISNDKALALLIKDCLKWQNAINELVKVPLTQNQFDALCSLIHNIGIGAFRNSTLLSKLNAQDYEGAANEFLKWVFSNDSILKGLVERRYDERELFLS